MNCPSCRASLTAEDRFCPACGSEAPPALSPACVCGASLESADRFCPSCGKPASPLPVTLAPPVIGPPPAQVAPVPDVIGPPPSYDRSVSPITLPQPAPIGRRLVAYLLDSPVLLLPVLGSKMSNAGALLAVGAVWLYFALLEGLAGGSIGKLVAGLRVYQLSGDPAGFGRTARRAIPKALYILGLPLLVDAILACAHPQRRTLGDLMAGTMVSRKVLRPDLDYVPPPGEAAGAPPPA